MASPWRNEKHEWSSSLHSQLPKRTKLVGEYKGQPTETPSGMILAETQLAFGKVNIGQLVLEQNLSDT